MAQKTKKNIKLEYFRVTCRELQDMDTSSVPDSMFDLYRWIDVFDTDFSGIEDKTFMYAGERARLDDIYKTENYWVLDFLRLRDSNLPKRAYENKQTEDMQLDDDEYMGEEAIAIYDPETNVLALQRNRNSLSVTGIEKYLNDVWQHRDNNVIYLRPILSEIDLDAILKKTDKDYRKIRFKIADTDNLQEADYDNSPLGQILKGVGKYQGAFVDVTISMGHFRDKSLNDVAVNNTLNELVNNASTKKAEISIKEDADAPVEIIDLLSDKLSDYVQIEYELKKSIPSNILVVNLLKQYKQSKHKIKKSLKMN
ncbi:MAG: hypothetical protein HFE51_10500 [Clostridia bacterium]|nr:hypothetical protein [Clostridia bacterium]MCI9086825.1 hypothetical protein [Clostridia bacterium]